MSFASGKLNASLDHLYRLFISQARHLSDTLQSSSAYAAVKGLQDDIERFLSVIINKQEISIGQDIDPFFLRNEVALFDESQKSVVFQSKTSHIVKEQLFLQSALLFTSLFGTYLGIPLAI